MTMPEKPHRVSQLSRETWGRRVRQAWARRARTRANRSLVWRLCVPAVFLLAGALFITSAISSDGTDLRAGRYSDLPSLVEQETEDLDALRTEARALEEEVSGLAALVGDEGVEEEQQESEALRRPAGLVPVRGPGLTISLDDSPEEEVDAADVDPGVLVVHQQDIQAVVNALWSGGAEAMTIQGQRVISTTGIKCVGNTVVLHGVPYAPPYVITAVGDPDAMLTSVNASPYIEIYLQYVEKHKLGWEVEPHSDVRLPGYEGSLDLDYARAPSEDEPNDSGI